MKMNIAKILFCSLLLLLNSCAVEKEENNNYAELVNPFIGTDGPGNTYPGAQVPFGMVQLSPDNGIGGWDRIAGYFYPDSTIGSFSMTHLSGTGAGDLYDIAFMPVMEPRKNAKDHNHDSELGIYSTFSHDQETAHAGYYSVLLKDYDIQVELTASERCGVQLYTFNKEGDASIILDLKRALNWDFTMDTEITFVDSQTITGYRFSKGWADNQKIFFVATFSKPFDGEITTDVETKLNGNVVGRGKIATLKYQVTKGEQITVKCAISSVSVENAMENLKAEVANKDFTTVKTEAEQKWNKELAKIKIETLNHDDKVVFYTCLYQSMLAPTIYQDVNGEYRGADYEIHQATDFTHYTRFSLWDTYRAAHPLYTIMHPERVNDMVKTFIAFYEQHGATPVWSFQGQETDMMLGYHSVPVITEAYIKGIGNFDAEKALEACVATANRDEYRKIGFYKKHGYVPSSEEWNISKTLEYAYDDYCIAVLAEKLGKQNIAREFYMRSQNYKNQFNPASKWFEPKDENGNWLGGFNPDEYTFHISESNSWHYFFAVQHNVEGLMDLLGGEEAFRTRLDSMFTVGPHASEELPIFSTGMIGQYAHGNEPSHHVAYLYNYTIEPWKAQKYARQIAKTMYSNKPNGHCGNEDCGQMSSWYVFSSLGFYPVDPVTGVYHIGSPLFNRSEITLPDNKSFVITAENNSPENVYIQSMTLNGNPHKSLTITHKDIMSGGTLHFVMGAEPKNTL